MKCCTIWYLEALRKIKEAGTKFRRTLYLTVVPGIISSQFLSVIRAYIIVFKSTFSKYHLCVLMCD